MVDALFDLAMRSRRLNTTNHYKYYPEEPILNLETLSITREAQNHRTHFGGLGVFRGSCYRSVFLLFSRMLCLLCSSR